MLSDRLLYLQFVVELGKVEKGRGEEVVGARV